MKTQQFSEHLIKSQKKRSDSAKTNISQSVGRWSFRLPKLCSPSYSILRQTEVSSGSLVNKKMSAAHKVKDWLNDERRTPLTTGRPSVPDLRGISTIAPTILAVIDKQETQQATQTQEQCARPAATPTQLENKDLDSKQTILTKQTQPRSFLRRSLSDLRERSLAGNTFLVNRLDTREGQDSSTILNPIRTTLEDLRDKVDNLVEQDPVAEKDNDDVRDVEETIPICVEKSKIFGSILKKPGLRRTSIKHVEFLENNGGDEEQGIRYY